MKGFRFLGIILCAFISISTYNANGMDTSRPRNDSFGYNESNSQQKSLFYDKQNVLDSIIDDYIKQFEIETDYKFSRKYSYDVESSVVFRQKNVFPQFRTNYNFSRKYSNDVESSVTFNYRQKKWIPY